MFHHHIIVSWLGSELMEAACFHIEVSGGSFRRLAGSGDGRCSIGVGRASDNIVEAIVVLVVASSGCIGGCIGGCVEVVTRLVVASSGCIGGCIEVVTRLVVASSGG